MAATSLEKNFEEKFLLDEELAQIESAQNENEKLFQLWTQDLKLHEKLLHQRVEAIYKLNRIPHLAPLLKGSSHDVYRNIKVLKLLSQRDVTILREYKQLIKQLREQQKLIGQKKEDAAKVALAIKAHEEKINQDIELLKNDKTAKFLSKKKTLIAPVNSLVTQKYGLSQNSKNSYAIFYRGLFFKADAKDQVRAVQPGVVVYSETIEGYGLVTIVDHGENFHTVYAGLQPSLVNLGDKVAEGQMIGTGGGARLQNQKGLYFEILHGETPLNPSEWLKELKYE